jgi:hypothetical protein
VFPYGSFAEWVLAVTTRRAAPRFQLSLAHAAASTVMGSGRAAFTLTDEWTSAMPVRSLSGTHAPDQDRSLMPKDRDKPNDMGSPFTSANGVRFGSRGTGPGHVDGRRDGGPGG